MAIDFAAVTERAIEEVARCCRLTLPEKSPGIRILDRIVRELHTPLQLLDLCSSWKVQPSSLRSRFARRGLSSLTEFSRHVRAYYVLAILRAGGTLGDATGYLQFSQQSAMTRQLKGMYGMPASVWAYRTRMPDQLEVIRSIVQEYAQVNQVVWNFSRLKEERGIR